MYIISKKYTGDYSSTNPFFSFEIIYRLMLMYSVVAVASSIKIFKYWYNTEYLKQTIEKEKLQSELKYLKSQIHPHFLFNTLNNLYALALENDSRTPQIVLKLSELLDYMLYECDSRTISLDKEIDLLQNYLDLEKIRYDDEFKLDVNIIGNSDGKTIAPLLLLPLVENAFKHGISQSSAKSWLKIILEIEAEKLHFSITNSKVSNAVENDKKNKGIGLQNLCRRLELMYNQKYKLEIQDTEAEYAVNLELEF